jgi:hypothetical protein
LDDIEQSQLCRLRLPIYQIHDLALVFTHNSCMRFCGKVAYGSGVPVISAGKTTRFIHSLLDNDPFAIGRNNEAVKIDLEAISDRVVIDPSSESTRAHECLAIESAPI